MSDYQLDKEIEATRASELAVQPLILNRWSPRSFAEQSVLEKELLAILEAARWAPSCFNEQPWRFIVARTKPDLDRMRECLAEKNRSWADRAPMLIAVISAPDFALNGRPNRWNGFDAGTAWGYLALEANSRGLIAHAMGGFSQQKIREQFGVPEAWGIHAVVALGYRGPVAQLLPELQALEQPNDRRPLSELWAEGRFAFAPEKDGKA